MMIVNNIILKVPNQAMSTIGIFGVAGPTTGITDQMGIYFLEIFRVLNSEHFDVNTTVFVQGIRNKYGIAIQQNSIPQNIVF